MGDYDVFINNLAIFFLSCENSKIILQPHSPLNLSCSGVHARVWGNRRWAGGTSKFISNPRGKAASDLSTAATADGKGELVIYPAESVQDRAGNETKVTRRDETRDGLVQFVSRPKLTRRDEVRDQVHEEQNFTQDFYPNFDILYTFFSSRRSRETMSRDETRSRRSRLVSRFFEARPSRYRP